MGKMPRWSCQECDYVVLQDPQSFTEMFAVDKAVWTSLRRHVVRVAIEYLGWGCWDFIRHQLHGEVSRDQLHHYLHAVTRLATFRGLEGLHLDVEDLARYVTHTIFVYNESWKEDLQMHSYLPPQFYWYQSWQEVSD